MAQEKIVQKKVEKGGAPKAETKAPVVKPKLATGVTVVHGPLLETYDLSGVTVNDAVDMLKGPLGIDPNVNPLVNGEEVDGDVVLTDGDTLEFVRGAGEKGADKTLNNEVQIRKETSKMIRGGRVAWEVPTAKLSKQLFKAMGGDYGLLHPFTRMYQPIGVQMLTVLEIPPHCRTVRWISGDHDNREGHRADGVKPSGTRYETRFLSFPWVVILFSTEGGHVTGHQELFYRAEPMRPGSTELFHSNMCNVAKGYGWKAWLCLQYLRAKQTTQAGLADEVIHHAFNAAFNRSSEINEGNSGWNAKMRKLDGRLKDLKTWEQASKREPGFILGVPWPSAKTTLEMEVEQFKQSAGGGTVAPNLYSKLYYAGMHAVTEGK